jgi:hypothetical protein
MDEALKKDPDLTELHKTRRQVGELLEKPEIVRDACLGIASAGDSTLLEVLEAKAGAAKAMLETTPPDAAGARRLIEEVLAVDPAHAAAGEVLKVIEGAAN